MNNQEIFDTAATHLIKQGEPGVNRHGDCMYRGEGGTMCAVGVLIPDEKYKVIIEAMPLMDVVQGGYIPNIEDNRAGALLRDLQGAHDDDLLDYDGDGCVAANFDAWGNTMRDIANEYNLNTNVLYDALKEAGHNVPS